MIFKQPFLFQAPRESTKASKNYVNRTMVQMDSLETAIVLQEETEMAIQDRYLEIIGDEISSSKSKAKLATLARHFRLQKLKSILMEIIEMEGELQRWHKHVKAELPSDIGSCVQRSTKQLEEVR
jgi:hypothetical protein